MKTLHLFKANVHACLAALALLLLSGAFPPSARGDQGLFASCGFSGVQTLVLQPGEKLLLPFYYENLTGARYTFTIQETHINKFSFPGDLLSAALAERGIQGPLVLEPGTHRMLGDDLGY